MTESAPIKPFVVDTVSDDNIWVVLRRIHFFIGDVIEERFEPLRVGVMERRILEALTYAETSGTNELSAATLCVLIPVAPKPATAASALKRMEQRGWVTNTTRDDDAKTKLWLLTDEGRKIRELYRQIGVEAIQQVHADNGEHRSLQLYRWSDLATSYMNNRVVPILDFAEGVRSEPLQLDRWSALLRIHFYINDLIFREIEPVGVGQIERRIFDVLGFARKHNVNDGLDIATMCRLNEALNRQTGQAALERMLNLNWVSKQSFTAAAGLRWRWNLTPDGSSIREIYKRYAQHKFREVYESAVNTEADRTEFLLVSQSAQAYRDSRLLPILDRYRRGLDALAPSPR